MRRFSITRAELDLSKPTYPLFTINNEPHWPTDKHNILQYIQAAKAKDARITLRVRRTNIK
jgi:hypothetical protein